MGSMKLRPTTPVSKGLVTKSSLVASAVVMALAVPISFGQVAFADRFDEQIKAFNLAI